MCEKYLVYMEGGDHTEFVDTLDAVKEVVINRTKDLAYDTVEDYLLDYGVEVYKISKRLELKVETTIKVEFI